MECWKLRISFRDCKLLYWSGPEFRRPVENLRNVVIVRLWENKLECYCFTDHLNNLAAPLTHSEVECDDNLQCFANCYLNITSWNVKQRLKGHIPSVNKKIVYSDGINNSISPFLNAKYCHASMNELTIKMQSNAWNMYVMNHFIKRYVDCGPESK